MREGKCSPGPWKAIENSWQYTTIYDAHDREICRLDLERFEDLNEETQDKYEAIQRADAAAIVLACDHDAALRRAKAEGRQEGKEYALNEAAMRAGCAAHRACCGIEADNSQGKIHGYCVVCGVPWPCETAQFFLFKADARAAQIEEGE